MESGPKTLQQAVVYFNDPDNCVTYLVARRWPNGVVCPTCGSTKVSYLKRVRRWQCSTNHDKRQFTLKTGTVMGILERGGKVRTKVIPNRKKHALQTEVRKHVEAGSALYSDALQSYNGLAGEYAHQVIDHAVAYVDGQVHTNGLENFWSLVKRTISGTYVSVEL